MNTNQNSKEHRQVKNNILSGKTVVVVVVVVE